MTDQACPNERQRITAEARRVVIKVGTAVLMSDKSAGIAADRFLAVVGSIAELKRSGREVLLVSSGAIGLGAERLGLPRRPQLVSLKQACAAVGQGRLMSLYSEAFDRHGVSIAQVLLTEEDFSNRKRYLNLRSTITKLLELGVLPIINENDTVSTAEIEYIESVSYAKVNFGDNDKLSALVASKMEADLLVLLTDVAGLHTDNPVDSTDARLIPLVERITPEIEELATDRKASRFGRGGMKTKLEAARIAGQSACAVIITSGKVPHIIDRIFSGEELGTLFIPNIALPSKQRWIAFATTVTAAVVINEGARHALVEGKASLLPAGVLEVRGDFERGDAVSILDEQQQEFARGIVNYSGDEARRITGKRSNEINELVRNRNYDALITRDNIAFLDRR
jgi:glutamate 5-kinase